MAKVPDNSKQDSIQSLIDAPIINIKKQIAETEALIKESNDAIRRDQHQADLTKLKERLEQEKTNRFKLEKEILDKRTRIVNDAAEIEFNARKAVAIELAEAEREIIAKTASDTAKLEAGNIEVTEATRAALREKHEADNRKKELQGQIEILNSISKKSQKEREKELKVLDAKKKVLAADRKLEEAKKDGNKKAQAAAKKEKRQANKELNKETGNTLGGGILNGFKEQFKELTDEVENGNAVSKAAQEATQKSMQAVGKAITEGLNAINNSITAYAKHQTSVNARLNGITEGSATYAEIADSLNSIAFSPLLNAEELYNNVAEIVNQGIAVNVEQRAMFATLKDGIAGTFDVTADSLKRIIRLQQNDSTAARLGLEAYLNEFLNVYVQNTEYLQSTFDTVADSLLEASALMKFNNKQTGVQESLEFEYQVQKWLGVLGGYGFSDEAAQNIANAIGQLATGSVDELVNSDINNLLLMAANKGGVNYSNVLSNGASAQDINNLMYGVVSYMHDIAKNDNNIIKNQLAKVFGVGITDLIAATNIQTDVLEDLRKESLSYEGMYGALEKNFDALPKRLGISNILENAFANLSYQTGANIAKNPALYAMWKITDMIQNVTSGIPIPWITAIGNGFSLETTVENLMKMGIAGRSLLGNIGSIVTGIATAVDGSMLLTKAKVDMSGATIKQIKGGLSKTSSNGKRASGDSGSEAAVVGNEDGATYQDAAVNDASDDANKKLDVAREKEEQFDPTVKYLKEDIKFKDNLTAILSYLMLISGSVDDVDYIVGALEQNIRTAYKNTYAGTEYYQKNPWITDPEKYKELKTSDEASSVSSADSSGIKLTLSSVADTSINELTSQLTTIADTLDSIKTLNEDIVKLIPTIMGGSSSSSTSTTTNESLTVTLGIDTKVVVDALNESTSIIKAAIYDALNITTTELVIPKGETSILSPKDIDNSVITDVSESIINSSAVASIGGYISSDVFATDFKSIVENVARLAGERSSKDWSNPASGNASGSINNNHNSYNFDDSIDGLTQHSSGYNPLFI